MGHVWNGKVVQKLLYTWAAMIFNVSVRCWCHFEIVKFWFGSSGLWLSSWKDFIFHSVGYRFESSCIPERNPNLKNINFRWEITLGLLKLLQEKQGSVLWSWGERLWWTSCGVELCDGTALPQSSFEVERLCVCWQVVLLFPLSVFLETLRNVRGFLS